MLSYACLMMSFMSTSMPLVSISMFTLAVVAVTVFSLHPPVAVFLPMSPLLPVSISMSMSFPTVNVSMFTLAVVAVAVGTLDQAGCALPMTAVPITSFSAGDHQHHQEHQSTQEWQQQLHGVCRAAAAGL